MTLDRRTVLIGGGAGVGLVVAFALWPRGLRSDLPVASGEEAFGNFIKVAKDGRVTVAVPQAETGQGIWTGLAQIVADELGADWESIAVEPAPLTGAYGNRLAEELGQPKDTRITAGSTSVRAFERPLREAAAIAREMLVGAAADRWDVSPADCVATDGVVMNGARTFSFGELAEEAAHRSAPRAPTLRQDTKNRLIDRPLPRLDGPAKSSGSWRFAGDVRLPGMLFASARLAPANGKLEHFDREAVSRMPGVRHLAAHDDALAVAAETWWAAEQAVKAARPRFSAPESPADLRSLFTEALDSGNAKSWFSRGDYDRTLRGLRALAATYFVAPSQHLGLESLTTTARFTGDHLEVWAPTQAPEAAKAQAEKSAGGARVSLYPMSPGAPSGRALAADAIPLAVTLARATGRPVQLMLSQSASQNHDRPSGGALAKMMALPDPSGTIAAWKMRMAASGPEVGFVESALPYSIPNVSIEGVATELPFEPGYMRGSPQREFAFFTESFADELARRSGLEPLAFRMAMLGGNGRLARCLQAATRLAGWDGGGPGSTMGIAGVSAFGSHIGLVANATIGEDQRVKVHKLVAAVDCGRAVNSGLVTQQIEAGMLWALAQASVPAPEWVAGMPRARAFGAMDLPRLDGTPEVMVQVISSSEAPGGVSGLGTTVVAPAVANAIFAGTGRRLRDLPFDLSAA